jgi:hypothetical protein
LGSDPFRSPLLRTSRLISLPPGTEMFQFPGFASRSLGMTGCNTRRVAPFGHLRITACVPLPGASRSLPRPSSPLCAQASPTCLLSLDYNRQSQAELRAIRFDLRILSLPHMLAHARPMKIPIPTISLPAKRHESEDSKTDNASSVLHFSISSPRFQNSRGEPCIVNALRRAFKYMTTRILFPIT